MNDVYEETIKSGKFKCEGWAGKSTKLKAKVGDRLVANSFRHDNGGDILEVVKLLNSRSVAARAIADCESFKKGGMYKLPLTYTPGFPTLSGTLEVSLYSKV